MFKLEYMIRKITTILNDLYDFLKVLVKYPVLVIAYIIVYKISVFMYNTWELLNAKLKYIVKFFS